MEDLKRKIGQLFIVGFNGETPSTTIQSFLSDEQIGGVILFEESCRTHQMARDTINSIRKRYRSFTPLIAIDQEGGRVCRLRGAPAEYQSAADYGRTNRREQFAEDFRRAAVFMESLGINLLLGPVVDLELNDDNPCLKDRCFGATAAEVIPFIKDAVRIAHQSGLLCCLKHFPGLGAAAGDPHLAIVNADYDLETWTHRERLPLSAGLEAGADLLMTTHLRLSSFDNQIVTGSSDIIETLARQRLKFSGPIITDDLTMSGAEALGNIGKRTVKAFVAGHDILLFGRNTESAMEAHAAMQDALDSGDIRPERIREALGRIASLKIKLDATVIH
jgi:beta-N-acetylhexosaminidase